VIALANLLLAVVMLIVAQRSKPGREMELLAFEVRNSALQALESNARALQQQFAEFREEVREVREAVVGFVRHPLDSGLPGLLVPIAGAVIKGLKKPE
jgi:hypothetical protein